MDDSIFSRLEEGRRQFLALIDDVRPDLHRYCARMTGSVIDGEDVVQDTLARAYYELSELNELPALRGWLFRIAHNRALDYLRRSERRMSVPLDLATDTPADDRLHPDELLDRGEVVRAAVSRFLELAPVQRSCVVLKDVLDHSLDEIAALLELSVPAVKAALHGGRGQLRSLSRATRPAAAPRAVTPALVRYAALFNARDWDGVRAMLVDEVKLDLVSRVKRAGRREVSVYFTNYDWVSDWHLVPAWLDGREVLAVFRDRRDRRPDYFVDLTVVGDRVAAIRDYRYVPYVAREAVIDSHPCHPLPTRSPRPRAASARPRARKVANGFAEGRATTSRAMSARSPPRRPPLGSGQDPAGYHARRGAIRREDIKQ